MYCTNAELKEIYKDWLFEHNLTELYSMYGFPLEGLHTVDIKLLYELFEAIILKESLKRHYTIRKCTCSDCQKIEAESEEDDHRKFVKDE